MFGGCRVESLFARRPGERALFSWHAIHRLRGDRAARAL